MTVRAVLFDLYNTLIEIQTDEHDPAVWQSLARFLRYQGLHTEADSMYKEFFKLVKLGKQESFEDHPEVNLLEHFRTLLHRFGYNGPDRFCVEITQMFRALTMRRFVLFPEVVSVLQSLQPAMRLGVVSDAQRAFLEPEMALLGLTDYMDVVVVSGDHGFRKPDPRLFRMALAGLNVSAHEAVYIGDHSFRDVCGAQAAGMKAFWLRRHHQKPDHRSCPPDAVIQSLDELPALLGLSAAAQI